MKKYTVLKENEKRFVEQAEEIIEDKEEWKKFMEDLDKQGKIYTIYAKK